MFKILINLGENLRDLMLHNKPLFKFTEETAVNRNSIKQKPALQSGVYLRDRSGENSRVT